MTSGESLANHWIFSKSHHHHTINTLDAPSNTDLVFSLYIRIHPSPFLSGPILFPSLTGLETTAIITMVMTRGRRWRTMDPPATSPETGESMGRY